MGSPQRRQRFLGYPSSLWTGSFIFAFLLGLSANDPDCEAGPWDPEDRLVECQQIHVLREHIVASVRNTS